jgi:hypothetical protein
MSATSAIGPEQTSRPLTSRSNLTPNGHAMVTMLLSAEQTRGGSPATSILT